MIRLGENINFVTADEYNKIPQQSEWGHYSGVRHHFALYVSYCNTYIYDVFEFLGRHLIKAKVQNVVNSRNKVKEIEKWRYVEETRKSGKKYYIFQKELSNGDKIVLEVPLASIYKSYKAKDSSGIPPIVIKYFEETQDIKKDPPKWTVTLTVIYNTTIDAKYKKRGDGKLTMRIDLYGTHYSLHVLNVIRDLPNRGIDFTYCLKKVKLHSPELYLRFPRYSTDKHGNTVDNLQIVHDLLNELLKRIGIKQQLKIKGTFENLEEYSNIVEIIWRGFRFRLKLYITKYHPYRDPKLEITIADNIEIAKDEIHNPEKLTKRITWFREMQYLASGILGAIATFVGILPKWDLFEDYQYPSQELLVDKGFLALLKGMTFEKYITQHAQHFSGLDDLDYKILNAIIERPVITVKELIKKLSKSESTIRRRLEKLEKLGYISGTKGKKPNYYWLRLYDDLSETSIGKSEKKEFPYVDPSFMEYAVSIIRQLAPNYNYNHEDFGKMAIILWTIGIGLGTHDQLVKFVRFFGKIIGLKRLSKSTISKYLKFLIDNGLVTVEKFKAGKKKVERYILLNEDLATYFRHLEYYEVFGI
jgi:predicted transcriptional regulator